MNTKLTVRLDSKVIERAKKYARSRKTSVSRIIESYLGSVTRRNTEDFEITPLVQSISGIIKIVLDYDYKTDYSNYLSEKYK